MEIENQGTIVFLEIKVKQDKNKLKFKRIERKHTDKQLHAQTETSHEDKHFYYERHDTGPATKASQIKASNKLKKGQISAILNFTA